jgi:hypothetical protein
MDRVVSTLQHVAWNCRLIQRILNQVVHHALPVTVAAAVVIVAATVVASVAATVVVVAETAAVTVVVSAAETVVVTEVLDQSGMLSHKRMHQPQSLTLKRAMACQRPASVHVADE